MGAVICPFPSRCPIVSQKLLALSTRYPLVDFGMKKTRTTQPFTLPPRGSDQTLRGFVRQHLKVFEEILDAGVSYESVARAVRLAGFGERSVVSLRVAVCKARKRARARNSTQSVQTHIPLVTQPAQPARVLLSPPPKDERVAIARRLRELARPPRKGEPDPLD